MMRVAARPLLWSLAMAGLALVTGCPEPEVPPVAQIKALAGAVTWRTNEAAEAQPAAVDLGLREGNLVATGADGTATIEFQGGNSLDLNPNTTLVVRKSGQSAAQFGAVILGGGAKMTSKGQGVLLAIGTPFGITELGAQASSIELSTEQGITVLVGEIALTTDAGRQVVTAGNTFTIGGLVIPIGGAKPAGDQDLVLNPMQFILLAKNTNQVQVKRAGENAWRSPRKREVLGPGDAVRTRKGQGTKVQFGEIADLQLTPRTEMTFASAGTSDQAHRAKYQVAIGNVIIHLQQDAKVGAIHEVEVAGVSIKVEPGLKEAAVEVDARAGNKAQIKVRFGRVRLSDGTTIDAGQSVMVEQGKVVGETRPLAFTRLDLKARSSSIVYYTGEVPPIEFNWAAEEGAKSYTFEVAADKAFERQIFREQVAGNTFVQDRIPPGRYYWRVKGSGEWVRGVLTIEKKADTDVKPEHSNTVRDSGEKTVIYYQKALPAVAFLWEAVGGATKYRLKIYPDGEFETPLADKTVAEPKATFKEGELPEGKYYWHQIALDDAGKDLKTGRMNTLQIAYDNAIEDLAIKTPRHGQVVTTASVVARGEVRLGATLTVNGRKADLDELGRFKETIKLDKGSNQLVFRTLSADGVERYYVRSVTRR